MMYKTHDELMDETRQLRHPAKKVNEKAVRDAKDMNLLCFKMLGIDEGAKLLDYLEAVSVGVAVVRKDASGGVDAYATVATARARDIFDGIRRMIKLGEKNE